jgi:zinc resistance-associated protein
MWKPVIVATTVLAIAGSSIVYAQQRFGGSDGYGDGLRFAQRYHHLSPEDRAAFVDARIAALKAGLELTPDQAKNWPAFEQALRDMAQLRAQRRAAREASEQNPSQTPIVPFDRLSQRADNMAKASAALKRIAETGQPLYMSLNEAQKERFKKLARMLRPHHTTCMPALRNAGMGATDMVTDATARGAASGGHTIIVSSEGTTAGS